ncbi:MAG TPA: hypothetical protein VFN21_02210 [Acidimicrobiales bacterium]|uniref:hypothetical protein n=1 Tax=Rhodococcus sp. SMB37 TaxID=2512213 RepID=UPI00104AC09E|nr:hypothetical protein [Rhodococcus sp. SMB37]TCN58414.1 hypothetical protein EV641_101517 [Rhodococcus sp. SMB37]HET8929450.1 hypothetical protein [Acidimicrobiales bacterium]
MPIDTFIDGDPADISRIGDWIRRSLAAAVEGTGDNATAALASVLADMAELCDRAAASGLSVVCNTIADPAPDSDETVLRAYNDAAAAAQDIHARWAREVAAVANRWAGEVWAASFTTSTGLDYLTAELKKTVQGLAEYAEGLTRQSLQSMQFVPDLPDGTPYDEVRRLYGQLRAPPTISPQRLHATHSWRTFRGGWLSAWER